MCKYMVSSCYSDLIIIRYLDSIIWFQVTDNNNNLQWMSIALIDSLILMAY